MNDETTVAGELEKAGGEALTQTETAPEAAEPSGETEKTENTQQSETTEAAKQTKKKNSAEKKQDSMKEKSLWKKSLMKFPISFMMNMSLPAERQRNSALLLMISLPLKSV
jgi:hypothetical protein